jgi:tetratricopeptide (TPR) repeat protein
MSAETHLPSIIDANEENKNNVTTLSAINKAQEKIAGVLSDVERIEEIEGTKIEKIEAGELKLFKKDLLIKDAITQASAFYYTGEYNEALEWYEKVIVLDANKADVWFNKGVILARLERYRDAINAFDKALGIKPDYAAAWYNMGVCFGNIGKHKQAIKCFDKIKTIGMFVR